MATISTYPIRISGQLYNLGYRQALQQSQQFIHQSRWLDAQSIWQQLARQLPLEADSFQHLFRSYFQQANYQAMITWADYCLDHSPHQLLALKAKAKGYRFLQKHSLAIDSLHKAQQLAPHEADLHLQLGILYKELGHYEQALDAFQQCIQIQPDHHNAYWQQADLQKNIPLLQLQYLQKKASDERYTADARAHFAYAAARGYELQQQDELCFELYHQGAVLKRQQLNYDHAFELQQFDKLQRLFNDDFPSTSSSSNDNAIPIFIAGLPRSGTTLTEQILSNHSDVSAGDELFELARATEQSLPVQWRQLSFPDWMAKASPELWATIGKQYLENTKHLQQHRFFTDKMPLNFKAIGLIHLALPQAKIIYCQRDPMDTLWGCFRQLFADGIAFSYDLNELTDTIIATTTLIQHWQQLLPGKIFTLDYEELLKQPDQQILSLLAHCDLPWQNECLQFHTNPRAVHTVSNSQIRQPLSKSRLGRWQRFAKQLMPYQIRLQQELGYEPTTLP